MMRDDFGMLVGYFLFFIYLYYYYAVSLLITNFNDFCFLLSSQNKDFLMLLKFLLMLLEFLF